MEGKIEKGINIAGIASNGVNTAVINPAPKAPTKSDKEKTLKETYTEALKEKDGLDKEFKEVRKIKIGLTADITVGSVYRQINRQYIQDRHDSIGGSINSARMLASNAEEMAAYMPAIVGCSANDTKFQERVSRWFQNISIPVPMDGYEFNCDFRWRRKEDYLKYAIKEQTIIEAYENADKSTAKLLKEAINNYVIELNALESTRYQYGRPDNIEHYIAFNLIKLVEIISIFSMMQKSSKQCLFVIVLLLEQMLSQVLILMKVLRKRCLMITLFVSRRNSTKCLTTITLLPKLLLKNLLPKVNLFVLRLIKRYLLPKQRSLVLI